MCLKNFYTISDKKVFAKRGYLCINVDICTVVKNLTDDKKSNALTASPMTEKVDGVAIPVPLELA